MSGAENMLPKYTGKAMTSRLQRIPFLPSAFSLAVGVFTLGVADCVRVPTDGSVFWAERMAPQIFGFDTFASRWLVPR